VKNATILKIKRCRQAPGHLQDMVAEKVRCLSFQLNAERFSWSWNENPCHWQGL